MSSPTDRTASALSTFLGNSSSSASRSKPAKSGKTTPSPRANRRQRRSQALGQPRVPLDHGKRRCNDFSRLLPDGYILSGVSIFRYWLIPWQAAYETRIMGRRLR